MKQNYVDQLTANYTGVEKFYFTADGTAFLTLDHAVSYSKKLGNGEIKSVAHGGQVADAVLEVANDMPALAAAEVATSEEPKALADMSAKELKEICAAKGIAYKPNASKAVLVEMIEAAEATATAAAKDAEGADDATGDADGAGGDAENKTTGEATEPQA
jgi:hypothetical protein